jgi:orotidine-5'-phosphate decarboxylase
MGEFSTGFREKWLAAAEAKNSVLCAGLDPAEQWMKRGEKGLPFGISKRDWSRRYVQAVAPFCAALKPNLNYWGGEGDFETLADLSELAHSLGMVVIDDRKLADIGETNAAGLFYSMERGVDAVTYSPFAGNMKQTWELGNSMGLGIIGMCLMSNPEYAREKKKLVYVDDEELRTYPSSVPVTQSNYVQQYIQLAHDAHKHGLEGIVIGAPSPKNHVTLEELGHARSCVSGDMLVLMPGVGAQGGEAEAIWKYFGPNNVMVNVGRELMFPAGSKTPAAEQAAKAKFYMEMLNEKRKR